MPAAVDRSLISLGSEPDMTANLVCDHWLKSVRDRIKQDNGRAALEGDRLFCALSSPSFCLRPGRVGRRLGREVGRF